MRILPDHTVNEIQMDSLAVRRPAQCTVAAKEGGVADQRHFATVADGMAESLQTDAAYLSKPNGTC